MRSQRESVIYCTLEVKCFCVRYCALLHVRCSVRVFFFFFSSASVLCGCTCLCWNNLNVWLQATLRCRLIIQFRLDKFLPVRSNFKEIRTEPHLKYHYKSGQLECFFFPFQNCFIFLTQIFTKCSFYILYRFLIF